MDTFFIALMTPCDQADSEKKETFISLMMRIINDQEHWTVNIASLYESAIGLVVTVPY